MSLSAMLLSHDRCVTFNASYLIIVLYPSLKREPTQNTTRRLKIRKIALLDLTQLQNISTTSTKTFCENLSTKR